LDPVSFATAAAEPGSTLQLRSTVEQSISVAVPSGIQVSIDGSTVVLSGNVGNAAESKLAERMALLEPGVRSVRNELVVAGK
jgi:osmotically-inducible protein OsmY